jgi:hypothetical protein
MRSSKRITFNIQLGGNMDKIEELKREAWDTMQIKILAVIEAEIKEEEERLCTDQ